MARFVEPTKEQEQGWRDWVASRPKVVREIAERLEPWSLYRMKSTGERCTVVSISEDGTVKVNITGQFNATLFDRAVFGVDPQDLEPCDLPDEDEALGSQLSSEEFAENIDVLRATVRPDLWILGEDGVARRKQ